MNGFRRKPLAGFFLASAIGLGLAPVASAQPPEDMPHRIHGPGAMPPFGPGGMQPFGPDGMPPLHGLRLSETQRDQVFKIFHEQAPLVHERMKELWRSREELRKLAVAERFDEAKAREVANAGAKAMADLEVLRAQAMNRVRAVLTPEQRGRLEPRQ